jgi:hypothetical protein
LYGRLHTGHARAHDDDPLLAPTVAHTIILGR